MISLDEFKPKIISTFQPHSEKIVQFAVSQDENKFIFGNSNGKINMFNRKRNHCCTVFKAENKNFTCISSNSKNFHTNKQLVAFSFDNMPIMMTSCSVSKSKNNLLQLSTIHGNHQSFKELSFNADSTRLLAACSDKTVKVYDIQKKSFLFSLRNKGHTNSVESTDCSFQDRDLVCSGSSDGTLKLWDIRSGTLIDTMSLPKTKEDSSKPQVKQVRFISNSTSIGCIANCFAKESRLKSIFSVFDSRNSQLVQFYSQ
ncbi:MAG: U5 small nuclear ribonucleoprotein, partial [Paramarteilia canceri]